LPARGGWGRRAHTPAGSTKPANVRMLAHLVDLGDGAISVNVAKKVLLDAADGVVVRAQRVWESAGLPDMGTVSVSQLDKARAELGTG